MTATSVRAFYLPRFCVELTDAMTARRIEQDSDVVELWSPSLSPSSIRKLAEQLRAERERVLAGMPLAAIVDVVAETAARRRLSGDRRVLGGGVLGRW